MRLKIWGCRGSVPTPGRGTIEVGGNTSCVEVSLNDDTVLVLDAGTGIRDLGVELLERGTRRVHILLTICISTTSRAFASLRRCGTSA